MNDDWIVIPNWRTFQHYSDRDPVWIKLYTELNSRDDWLSCSCSARGLLVTCWVEFARSRGRVKRSHIARIAGAGFKQSYLDSLNHAGLIEFSASAPDPINTDKPLAQRRGEVLRTSPKEASAPPSASADGGGALEEEPPPGDRHVHERLLAEAAKIAAEWNSGGSDLFDEALDELERRYHTQLQHLEREDLWGVAFNYAQQLARFRSPPTDSDDELF